MMFDYVIASALREDDKPVLLSLREKQLTPEHWGAVEFARNYLGMNRALPTKVAVEGFLKRPLKETKDSAGHWLAEVQKNYKRRITEEAVMEAAKNPTKALQIMEAAVLEAQLGNDDSRIEVYEAGGADRFKAYRKNKGAGKIRHLSTGMDAIDDVTFGYWPSDFWIIGGAEGIGKTWLETYLAKQLDVLETANDPDGRPILLINTEVDDEEIAERIDAQRFNLPYGQMLSGTLTGAHERKWGREAKTLRSRLRIINDCYTMQDLERYITLTNPIAVFCDSIHLLVPDYEWTDIAKLGQHAKLMAKRHRCPIIANTHLKSAEGKDSSGTVDSFAYGKGFTRNASVAMLLFQDEVMELSGEIGFKFVKVRRGEKATLVYRHDWSDMIYYLVGKLGKPGSVFTEDDDKQEDLW